MHCFVTVYTSVSTCRPCCMLQNATHSRLVHVHVQLMSLKSRLLECLRLPCSNGIRPLHTLHPQPLPIRIPACSLIFLRPLCNLVGLAVESSADNDHVAAVLCDDLVGCTVLLPERVCRCLLLRLATQDGRGISRKPAHRHQLLKMARRTCTAERAFWVVFKIAESLFRIMPRFLWATRLSV